MKNQVLTEARANKITEILSADAERANDLLALSPEEALSKINGGLGCDFTLEELREYGEVLVKAVQLSEDALSGVAGGVGSDNVEENVLPFIIPPLVIKCLKWAGKGLLFGAGREVGGAVVNAVRP